MPEPYLIVACCSSITVQIARMALAKTMRDRTFDTIKEWRLPPEQESMISNLAIYFILGTTPPEETKGPANEEQIKRAKELIEKYPLQTFLSFPMKIDPDMPNDRIDLVDHEGSVLVRISQLAIPYVP
jgi:hypothetical protein